MALKAILDNLDGLADPIKSEYTEKDGKFFLSVEPVNGYELDDVSALKNALSSERGVTAAQANELKKFGSTWDKDKKQWTHSLDPNKAKLALAKYDEFMSLDPAKEADKIAETRINSMKEQMTTAHNAEMEPLKTRAQKLESAVGRILRTQVARSEIIALKGVPELLLPHVENMTRVVEKDDEFVVEVLDEKGNVRVGDAKGNPMTVKQLVEEMRRSDTFGRAFEGDGKSGSGKLPGGGGGGTALKRSTMTAQQKADYQKEHGQAAYLKLPLK